VFAVILCQSAYLNHVGEVRGSPKPHCCITQMLAGRTIPPQPLCPSKHSRRRRLILWAVLTAACVVPQIACKPDDVDDRALQPDEPDAGKDALVWPDGGPSECAQVTNPIAFELRPADILLLFDRSDSMRSAFGTGTRFSAQAEILKDLMTAYDRRVRFGFLPFPQRSGCGGSAAVSCCAGPPAVGVQEGNAAAIGLAIDDAVPVSGQTPTAGALTQARAYFAGLNDGITNRYVLLSTDGHPSCSIEGGLAEDVISGGKWKSGPCADALVAEEALRDAGVKVLVLGIGTGLDVGEAGAPSCLEELARRGGSARQMLGAPSFYPAASPLELERTLQTIFGAVTQPSCVLRLVEKPPDIDRVAVFFDGKQVPRDAKRMKGWDWTEGAVGSSLEVYGEHCRMLDRLQVALIEVRHGCPPCTDPALCE